MSENELDKFNAMSDSTMSKQNMVYEQIKSDILNNTYPEETVMVERKLSEIYNVSRSPIRKAIQQLTHDGLLTFVPGKGVVVAGFTIEDILEVYDLIEILQTYAVQSAINRMNEVDMAHIGVLLNNMGSAIDRGDYTESVKWDQDFHKFLVEKSGNKRLETIYNQLNYQSMRFIVTSVEEQAQAERSYKEHMEIHGYMKEKDFESAKKAIQNHYQHIKQYHIDKLLHKLMN